MSNLNYTNWWRNGTIGATKNSTEITGASTYWSTTNINPGDIFIDNSGIYEIQSVTDDTHLTLATPYLGETGTGLAYAIIRNFTATTNAKVAAMTSELMYEFARFIDKERSTITGKSAYEIAKDNGYVGTEAQWLESLSAYGQAKKNGYTGTMAEWLESLKAAGEWSSADSRITSLEAQYAAMPEYAKHVIDLTENVNNNAMGRNRRVALHNTYPRYKNLGTSITAAQYEAISSGSFDDLYVGDYWELSCGMAVIVQVGAYPWDKVLHMALNPSKASGYNDRNFAMNDTNTFAGGYVASKMHTETMPGLLAVLEAEIGAEHIQTHSEYLYAGSGENKDKIYNPSTAAYTGTGNCRLELFRTGDIVDGWGECPNAAFPYALFQVPGSAAYYPGLGENWLQEFTVIYTRSVLNDAPSGKHTLLAHFILIP